MLYLPEFQPDASARHTTLSGVEISQTIVENSGSLLDRVDQNFRLPESYSRGNDIPDITGLQICIDTTNWTGMNVWLDVNSVSGWEELAKGSVQKVAVESERVWVDVYFNKPIKVNPDWLTRQFRFGLQTSNSVWYVLGYPTPSDITLGYRLLAATADSGEDFLSNQYRSVVKRSTVESTDTVNTDNINSYWFSKPNPSKFAVESLYFDVRNQLDLPSVVDRILIDPITPGIYFNLYYSTEGLPGVKEEDWEQKLWYPVHQVFHAERRQEFALPDPVKASYMKVEFTHLQAQHYQAGTFAQPITYKKHPKWVLDYYLARVATSTDDPFIARRVRLNYNALDLAYNYYLDDLDESPENPALPGDLNVVENFLEDRVDVSDKIDTETLERINIEFYEYTKQPALRGKGIDYLLAIYTEDAATGNYPVERITRAKANTIDVSSLDRSQIVVEQNMPVMSFYVPSRHTYRMLSANFENDRAYYAGVRELAFNRDRYTAASDTQMYVENLADFSNVYRNDFLDEEFVYSSQVNSA